MSFIWNEIIYRPLFNLLIFFYNTIAFKDLGIAIILLTILIKLILYPLNHKMQMHQGAMRRLQGDLKKIQEEHKDDKVRQSEAMMALYKENKVNPFSSFIILIIQLPILIAIYKVMNSGLKGSSLDLVYSFISKPESLNEISFGLINLQNANILIICLAAVFQFLQGYFSVGASKDSNDPQAKIQRQTAFMLPILMIFIFWKLPSGIVLYIATTALVSLIQQFFTNKHLKNKESALVNKNNGKL